MYLQNKNNKGIFFGCEIQQLCIYEIKERKNNKKNKEASKKKYQKGKQRKNVNKIKKNMVRRRKMK